MVMQKLALKIRHAFNLKRFIFLLSAALLTTWYGLFWSVDYFAELTNGLRFMDMQPALDVESLFEQIRSYDELAAEFYLWWSLFDYAWPFITFTTMVVITAWLVGFLSDRWQRWLPLPMSAAYITVLMDWLENLGFATLIIVRPAEPLWLAEITVGLHAAKLLFNLLFNLGFLVVLVTVVYVKIKLWLTTIRQFIFG